MPFLCVLKFVGSKRLQSAGRQFAINTETLPADHLHGTEIQGIIPVGVSIASQNGAGRFLRVRSIEEFGPDLQPRCFRVKTHCLWRWKLFSQNYILLEKTLSHSVANIGLDRIEGVRIHHLVAADYLADAILEFADKNALAGVALGVGEADDFGAKGPAVRQIQIDRRLAVIEVGQENNFRLSSGS